MYLLVYTCVETPFNHTHSHLCAYFSPEVTLIIDYRTHVELSLVNLYRSVSLFPLRIFEGALFPLNICKDRPRKDNCRSAGIFADVQRIFVRIFQKNFLSKPLGKQCITYWASSTNLMSILAKQGSVS